MRVTPDARLDQALRRARDKDFFDTICVAVSGGGDSMALLHMAVEWARLADARVIAVTLDHGLRPEAAEEAKQVAETCAALGVAHQTLRWEGWDGSGNLQAAARAGRYDRIAEYLSETYTKSSHGLPVVLLAHTRDDIAETFVQRLGRGSGPDGLAAMREDWTDRDIRWLRPGLEIGRQELRDWLTARGIGWIEDPSNDDPRFDRVKVRRAQPLLDELGLTTERLAGTAHRMSEVSEVLRLHARDKALGIVRIEAGDVVIDAEGLSALPAETRDRIFAHAFRWVSGATYRPRLSGLTEAWSDLMDSGTATLSGCIALRKAGEIRILRELRAVAETTCGIDELWDNRWRVHPPTPEETGAYTVRALGEAGIQKCPDWRNTGFPRQSVLSSPAIWHEDVFVAAPLAGKDEGWSAEINHPWDDFFTSLLSH